jgi:hypothetical protein
MKIGIRELNLMFGKIYNNELEFNEELTLKKLNSDMVDKLFDFLEFSIFKIDSNITKETIEEFVIFIEVCAEGYSINFKDKLNNSDIFVCDNGVFYELENYISELETKLTIMKCDCNLNCEELQKLFNEN